MLSLSTYYSNIQGEYQYYPYLLIKNYFTLENLFDIWTYHIKFVGSYFYWFVTIFFKKIGLLEKNNWGNFFLSKSVSGYFKNNNRKNQGRLQGGGQGGNCPPP